MKYKAVIFDLDGTLIDSMGIWEQVDKEFLEKRNIPLPADLFEDVDGGNNFVEIAKYFKAKFELPETIEEIMAEWTEMVHEHYSKDVRLKPGAREFLDFLKESGLKVGVGTSNSLYLAKTVLEVNGVLDYFDSVIAGCEKVKGKPFPDIFLKVASELNVNPQECLVIEDVLVGVQAAENAGMDVFAIFDEHAAHETEQIKQITDYYAEDFNQIIDAFKAKNGLH